MEEESIALESFIVTANQRHFECIYSILSTFGMLMRAAASTVGNAPPAVGDPAWTRIGVSQHDGDFVADVVRYFDAMITSQAIEKIELDLRRFEAASYPHKINAGMLVLPSIPAFFSLFTERAVEWGKANVGTDYHGWPPVLNFCRVVRNAVVHGGTINISSSSAPKVGWRGLAYSSAEEGRKVIWTDIGVGDFILLLMDLEAELDHLGAPNPLP